jgi:hypothetical protein
MMRTSVCNRKLLQCHDEIAEKKTELEMRMREKVIFANSPPRENKHTRLHKPLLIDACGFLTWIQRYLAGLLSWKHLPHL